LSTGWGDCARAAMPIKKYFLWVGGILLSLMLALDAYLPKAEPHEEHEIDRTNLRIMAPDIGIAPDTREVAVSSSPVQDSAVRPSTRNKISATTSAAQALARREPGSAKTAQHSGSARPQSAKPLKESPAAQPAWSTQWSYDWSANWDLRGSIAEAPRSRSRRQVAKQPPSRSYTGGWNFNLAGPGAHRSCWGC